MLYICWLLKFGLIMWTAIDILIVFYVIVLKVLTILGSLLGIILASFFCYLFCYQKKWSRKENDKNLTDVQHELASLTETSASSV